MVGVDILLLERGIFFSDCVFLFIGFSIDDLDLGIEFLVIVGWGCEFGLVEETFVRYSFSRVFLFRLGWDDEL